MDTPPFEGNRGRGGAEGFALRRERRDMARMVQKFGGTSVADIDRIRNAARRVKAEVDNGNEVAVCVSAMAGVTNQLVGYVDRISRLYDTREYDAVVAAGEQITAGLMSLALQDLGVQARSWLGWQIPIHTDEVHGKARIQGIETEDLIRRFNEDRTRVGEGKSGAVRVDLGGRRVIKKKKKNT